MHSRPGRSQVRTGRTGRNLLETSPTPTNRHPEHASQTRSLQTPEIRTSKDPDRRALAAGRGTAQTHIGDMSPTPNPFRYKRSRRTAPGKGHYRADSLDHTDWVHLRAKPNSVRRSRRFSSSYGTCLRLPADHRADAAGQGSALPTRKGPLPTRPSPAVAGRGAWSRGSTVKELSRVQWPPTARRGRRRWGAGLRGAGRGPDA